MLDRTNGWIGDLVWTEDRVGGLRRFHADGLSARQIADTMGLTRNQVMGKCFRLGLSGFSGGKGGKNYASSKGLTREQRAERQKSGRADRGRQLTQILCAPKRPELAARPVPEREAHSHFLGKTFLALDYGECRYPLGGDDDGTPILFCGQPVAGTGESWCSHCREIVFQSPPSRRETSPPPTRYAGPGQLRPFG